MSQTYFKIYLVVTGIGLIALAVVFFGILPLVRSVQNVAGQIEVHKFEIAKIAAEITSYEASLKEFENLTGEKQEFENMVPVREEMVSLVLGLEQAAGKAFIAHQLTLEDREEQAFANPAKEGKVLAPVVAGLSGIEEVPYFLELSGNYRQLVDFFWQMENLPFFAETVTLSVTADSVQDELTKSVRNTGTGTSRLDGVLFIRNPKL